MPRKSPRAKAAALRSDAVSRKTLTREIQRQIKKFGLNQAMAAKFLNDATTQLNRLMRGHAEEFSVDRLVRFLLRLGSDVNVTIKHAKSLGRRGKSRIRVGH